MKKFYFFTLSFLTFSLNAQVGIGTSNPQGALHVYEASGTVATPNTGTIVLEHANGGGESSIIFKSASNAGSDYGYIRYQDNAGGNGSSNENGLLTIGIENDGAPNTTTWQDDINIHASGSVGIDNAVPNPSASLDLGATNKGLLVNRVALSSTTDVSTMAATPPVGLLVFNTRNVNDVTQGFYYYNGSRWVRAGHNTFSVEYNQTSEVRASSNNSTYVNLPGLNGTFTAPYTGTYQFIISAYYASGAPTNATFTENTSYSSSHRHTVTQYQDGASQGSVRFMVNNNVIKEKYITSVSKSFPGNTFYSLGQNTTMVANVSMVAGTTYNLNVQGREWVKYNSSEGYFGRSTSVYVGADGVSDAQYATMSITLVQQ